MHRRRVLQMGATLAALPLAGCTASSLPPNPAPPPTTDTADKAKVPAGGEPKAEAPDGGAAASAHGDEGTAPGPDPAAEPAQPEAPKSSFSRLIARVGKNHGHDFAITFADVQAGAEKTYTLAGGVGHAHSVTLSADDMKSLLAGQILRKKTTQGLTHAHRLLLRCAPPVDPPEWVSVCQVEFSGKDEHEIVIPAADMAAKSDRTYDVQGIAGHPHNLTITAADFEKLAKGEGVSLQTTRDESDAHLHVAFIRHRPPKKT